MREDCNDNMAHLVKRIVFKHFLSDSVTVEGLLRVKVTVPTERPELVHMLVLQPEQLVSNMLESLNSSTLQLEAQATRQ